MNTLVREVMVESVREAREWSRIVEQVPHAGLRGQFRESFLSRALRPWLPRGMELGTGVIVDEDGTPRKVNEDDIIIYAPDLLPAILPLMDRNIFLLDGVIAHIEVKSTLSSDELEAALKSAMSLRSLKSSYSGQREISAIFAYSSTVKLKSEIARIEEQSTKLGWNDTIPPISFICVDEKESYMHGTFDGKPRTWLNLAPDAPKDSTLTFISTIVSNLNEIHDSRKFVQLARFIYDTSKPKPVE